MKVYAIYCRDKPDRADGRKQKLREHFEHVERVLDQIYVAGPLKNETGKITGSLLIVKAESEAAARKLLEADPYFAADIWDSIEISEFTAAAGEWIGGKIW